MNLEEQLERQEKIAAGLKIAYERMLEFKRQKNSEVVVVRDGKIVRINYNLTNICKSIAYEI